MQIQQMLSPFLHPLIRWDSARSEASFKCQFYHSAVHPMDSETVEWIISDGRVYGCRGFVCWCWWILTCIAWVISYVVNFSGSFSLSASVIFSCSILVLRACIQLSLKRIQVPFMFFSNFLLTISSLGLVYLIAFSSLSGPTSTMSRCLLRLS